MKLKILLEKMSTRGSLSERIESESQGDVFKEVRGHI